MDALAAIMAHDAATARSLYFRPLMAQAALGASQRIMGLLGVDEAAPGALPS